MDELLQEFLTETGENLDTVDRELVRFEQDPNDRDILRNIFRLVHTVKGTCGFIGLPRLEALTHAAESVIGQFRDGATVSLPQCGHSGRYANRRRVAGEILPQRLRIYPDAGFVPQGVPSRLRK